jgi:hypothetical protein
MATTNSSPVLAIVSDNALTTWRCLTESKPSTFYPHGDIPISDVAWNHNGQGEFEFVVIRVRVISIPFITAPHNQSIDQSLQSWLLVRQFLPMSSSTTMSF